MKNSALETSPVSRLAAATIASFAFTLPVGMSLSSVPAPNHPRTMLWYLLLKKPGFKPPDWVFPLAWTGIEAGLAITAFRLLRAEPVAGRRLGLALWGWNVFMIGGWSQLFFKQRKLAISTVASASLIATSVALVKTAAPVDRTASRASLPLVGWVTFATLLTATIWAMNPRKR